MIRFCTSVFIMLSGILTAQNSEYLSIAHAPRKAVNLYDKAMAAKSQGDLTSAVELLQQIIEKEPSLIDAYIQLAAIRIEESQFEKAIQHLEHVVILDAEYAPNVRYGLADCYWQLNRFEEAIATIDDFLKQRRLPRSLEDKARHLRRSAEFARTAVKNPVPFDPKPLPGINTGADEYLPAISADRSKIVFTRIVERQEDLFQCESADGSSWTHCEPIDEINTLFNEGAHTLSADGQILIFTRCNAEDGFGSCDLYVSAWMDDHWSQPRNMGPVINSAAWDSQPSLSADGTTLFFTSARGGGNGGSDIWMSTMKDEGGWNEPINLGAVVNTSSDEASPFIHPDGQSLYFMSNGHPGMGGYDLFMTTWEAGEWTEAQNLGFPINTKSNEGAIFIDVEGVRGYFATDRVNTGIDRARNDIFYFDLPASIRPSPVTYVKILVLDQADSSRLAANYRIIRLHGRDTVAAGHTTDGQIFTCLPRDEDYLVHIETEGYTFYSANLIPDEVNSAADPLIDTAFLEEILHPSTDTSAPIVLKNIFFETGSSDLKEASIFELNKLWDLLLKYPGISIEIRGHTDDVGSESDNLKLSIDRARAVYQYLLDQQIDPSRLSYRGFGENRPVASNATPFGRSQNRRTEFVIFRPK